MKKILYISLVDWNWIKQRPQIIAEELSKNYEVYYLYPKYYKSNVLTNNVNTYPHLHLIQRVKMPYSARFSLMKVIDNKLSELYSKAIIKKNKPDVIYISHPDDYSSTIEHSSKFVIYDCMDNYSAFANKKKRKEKLIRNEKALCRRADTILVTSEYLAKKIACYGIDKSKIHLVRNGYSGNILQIDETVECKGENIKKIIKYFGTIGPWFDFDLLVEALNARADLEFHLAGPLDNTIPDNERIVYDGVIEHNQLFEYVKGCDALIMPFQLNDIVEAVDPVKLYEYINFNKPIVSVYYPEIERFNDFVFFYSDLESFIKALNDALSKGAKYNNNQRNSFLADNSWSKRAEIIGSIISAEEK